MSPWDRGLPWGCGLSSLLTLSLGLFVSSEGLWKGLPVSGGGAAFQEGTRWTGLLIFAGDGVLATGRGQSFVLFSLGARERF